MYPDCAQQRIDTLRTPPPSVYEVGIYLQRTQIHVEVPEPGSLLKFWNGATNNFSRSAGCDCKT